MLPIDPDTRRAALIATAVTVPLVIVIGLLLGGAGSGDPSSRPAPGAALPAVTVSAPPSTDSATISTCAAVISALPLTLGGHDVRRTVSTPASPSIVAWGDPAIVLRCGVARPKTLVPGSTDQLFLINHSVYVLPEKRSDATTFTVVDRAVYIDVTVPASYSQPPLGPIADAIAQALPSPVCVVDPAAPDPSKLCTRRP